MKKKRKDGPMVFGKRVREFVYRARALTDGDHLAISKGLVTPTRDGAMTKEEVDLFFGCTNKLIDMIEELTASDHEGCVSLRIYLILAVASLARKGPNHFLALVTGAIDLFMIGEIGEEEYRKLQEDAIMSEGIDTETPV